MKNKPCITGIGGIFFKSVDPAGLRKWYQDKLGFISDEYGVNFEWRTVEGKKAFTIWCPFPDDTNYFKKDFMINFRVNNLEGMLKELRDKGVEVSDKIEIYDYGKFGWFTDPEGNRIELWEADDDNYSYLAGDVTIK